MGGIDILLLVIIAVVTWVVASQGAWGAGLTFLCALFSGLLAMNFFEWSADFLTRQSRGLNMYADIICLLGLFAIGTFAMRMIVEHIAPTVLEIDGRLYHVCRWGFALATGYLTTAIVLTALHTAPLPRNFMGFRPERMNLMGMAAPDRQWLGFTQRVSEKILVTGRIFDGPRYKAPGTSNDVWPSFPIRYATRRELYSQFGSRGAGGLPSPSVAPAPPPPAPGGAPSGPPAAF